MAPLLTPALSEVISLSGPATRLLRAAPSLLAAADAALPAITRFTTAFKPAVDVILPAAQEVAPIINFVALYRQELVAAMGNLAADLRGPSAGGTTRRLGVLPAGDLGDRPRVDLRPDGARADHCEPTPTSPRASSSNVGRGGLLAANCNNAGNPSQVPLLFGNVPCRVQPPFNWGNGILSSYYPHVTRAPTPK